MTAASFQIEIPDTVLARARRGETGALEQIYRAFERPSYTLALRMLGNGCSNSCRAVDGRGVGRANIGRRLIGRTSGRDAAPDEVVQLQLLRANCMRLSPRAN